QRGALTAAELSMALGKSQPTLSRLLRSLASEVLVLGQGRATRYALPQTLLGQPARQPLYWTHPDGRIEHWGDASLLVGGNLHVAADGIAQISTGLPWFLTPLRAQGFLGRVLARQLAAHGLDANPERWPLEHLLFAALRLHDTPGALWLGDASTRVEAPVVGDAASFDTLAADVAGTLPAGSSAGGEQAKFLARIATGEAVLVKFTPPRGTPFGERWHDLLWAEHLALQLLSEHGVPVAASRIVAGPQRSHFVSTRFDRIGPDGRRHVVALDALHEAFVPGPRQHWAATCTELARQRRLPADAPSQALALLQFGRLIGNSDMHFGNLGVFVEPTDVAAGRGTLAPLYDMLPMRWRPDASSGELGLTPFTPDDFDLQSPARPLAAEFWSRVAAQAEIGRGFRALAREMLPRVA
ncbi:MAG TPA: HipA domain-containing protein, partial [Ideonella sp.]|nr:HipA domain-containing protein [Ideonella sp.]